MTVVLSALVVLGIAVVGHSAYVLASARRPPAAFTVSTATMTPSPARAPQSRVRSSVHPSKRSPQPARPIPFGATRLRIAGLHVDAPIVAALSADRILAPPENPSQVGWWVASALAGSPSGATVIVGHIDSAASGPGALFHLGSIKPGQTIELSNASIAARYRTVSLRLYPKTTGLPTTLFAPEGGARLVLVSCGGTFDAAKRSYRSNVVVIATPVG